MTGAAVGAMMRTGAVAMTVGRARTEVLGGATDAMIDAPARIEGGAGADPTATIVDAGVPIGRRDRATGPEMAGIKVQVVAGLPATVNGAAAAIAMARGGVRTIETVEDGAKAHVMVRTIGVVATIETEAHVMASGVVRTTGVVATFGTETTTVTTATGGIAVRAESVAMNLKKSSRRIASMTGPAASGVPAPRSGAGWHDEAPITSAPAKRTRTQRSAPKNKPPMKSASLGVLRRSNGVKDCVDKRPTL